MTTTATSSEVLEVQHRLNAAEADVVSRHVDGFLGGLLKIAGKDALQLSWMGNTDVAVRTQVQ